MFTVSIFGLNKNKNNPNHVSLKDRGFFDLNANHSISITNIRVLGRYFLVCIVGIWVCFCSSFTGNGIRLKLIRRDEMTGNTLQVMNASVTYRLALN